MDKILKTFDTQQADGWWIASTRDVDRQMDIVEPRGLELDNYRRNSVLLWAHDYSSPFAVIGRAAEIEVTDQALRIRPEFRAPAGDSDPMHIIRSLIEAGHVRALSVGFRPLEWTDNAYGGRTFTRAELLEISVVPVPAQQNAVREQLAYAIKSLGAEMAAAAPDAAPQNNVDSVATPEAQEAAQEQTPETADANAVAAVDADLTPEELAALIDALAATLAQTVDFLRGDES